MCDYTEKERFYTIVHDAENKEIDRLEGKVFISGKDYIDRLPVTYIFVRCTEQVISVSKIEKP